MHVDLRAAWRNSLEEAATRLADVLAARGVTEDELVADFKKWRAGKRKRFQREESH